MDTLESLIDSAREVSKNAYCPYSRFPVGASVRSSSGTVYSGCNVENATFGATICAERSAILQMVAAGEREVEIVVVYTPTQSPIAPCGSCRQVINEFGPQARIVSVCEGDERIDLHMSDLLPSPFRGANLQAKNHPSV